MDNTETIDDLMGYLDTIESNMAQNFVMPDLTQAQELHEEVSHRISYLESTIEKSKKTKASYETELVQFKNKIEKLKSDDKKRFQKKLTTQKSKYDDVLKRFQDQLDMLVKEKEELVKECQTMDRRVKIARQEAARIKAETEEYATQQIVQQRELAIAQERARNKALLEKKIKEVKEQTAKSLEPELQNLISRQARELDAMKNEQDEALKAARATAEQNFDEEKTRLVEQLDKERSDEIQIIEQRYQKQIEREREIHKEELDRLTQKLKTVDNDKFGFMQITKKENDAIIEQTRERWKAELEEEKKRSAKELEEMRSRLKQAIERAKKDSYATMEEREHEIREQLDASEKAKSKKKLSIIVKKLEEDTNTAQKRVQDEADLRVLKAQNLAKKAQAALESERSKNEREIELIKKEAADNKSLISRLEHENEKLLLDIEHQKRLRDNHQFELDTRIIELNELKEKTQQKECKARISMQEELSILKKQLESAKSEFQEQKRFIQAEKKEIEERHAEELASVSKKVKTLIESKENTIQSLRDQLTAAQQKLKEFDRIVHKQKSVITSNKKK